MLGQRGLFVAVLALTATSSLAFTTSPALARLSGNGQSAFTPLSTKGSLYVTPRRATQLNIPRASLADFGVESRVPDTPTKTKCACGSNKVYAECCKSWLPASYCRDPGGPFCTCTSAADLRNTGAASSR
eukprot:2569235-Rhodomonas_salina.1